MSTVLVKIAGSDETARIVFHESSFESAVNGTVGSAKLLVRDLDRTFAPVAGDTLELLIDGDPVWTGFVVSINRTYVFPALNVTDFGLSRFWRVEGVDLNTLFNKRFVYTKADPTIVFGKLYGPNQPDNDAIADLVADYLDLSGDSLDTSTKVEFVGNINVDQSARAWLAGDSFGQAMASIASLPGAVYFIDPAHFLVYTDANTANAPFGLSDQPSSSGPLIDTFGRTTLQGDGAGPTEFGGPDGPNNSAYGLGPGYIWSPFDTAYLHYDNSLFYCNGSEVVLAGGGWDSYIDTLVPLDVGGTHIVQFDFWTPALVDQASQAPAIGVWFVHGDGDALIPVSMYVWTNADGTWQIGCYDTGLSPVGPAATVSLDASTWYTAKMAYDTTTGAVAYTIWKQGDAEPDPAVSGTSSATVFSGPSRWVGFYPDGTCLLDFWNGPASGESYFTNLEFTALGTVGYREMTITRDGSSLANDVLAWGLGYGSTSPVFDRAEDAPSEALHGLWQAATIRNGIYKQATIDRVAESILDGSPENLRGAKDDKVSVSVVTYVPGFLPAQKVDFTSTVWGFEDVIPIRRMRVTFDAPDTPRYELSISHDIDAPWGFFDPFLLNLPKLPPLPHLQLPPFPFGNPVTGPWVETVSIPPYSANPAVYPPGLPDGISAFTPSGVNSVVTELHMTRVQNQIDSSGLEEGAIGLAGVDPDEFVFAAQIEYGLQTDPVTFATTPWHENLLAQLTPIQVVFGATPSTPYGIYGVLFSLSKQASSSVAGGDWQYSLTVSFNGSYQLTAGGTQHNEIDGTSGGGIHSVPVLTVTDQTFLAGLVIIDRSLARGTVRFYYPLTGWLEYPITQSLAVLTTTPDLTTAHELDRSTANVSVGPGLNESQSDLSVFGLNVPGQTLGMMGALCEVPSATDPTTLITRVAFVPDSTLFFRAGLLQIRGTDYTEGGDTMSITLSDPLAGGESLLICYRQAILG
jgi:hypothetical protein